MAHKTPLYDIDDVVYLKSSAARGFLEPLRVSGIAFDRTSNSWIYRIRIESRAPRGQTVGDFNDLKKEIPFSLSQGELVTFCEAIELAETNLTNALTRIQSLRADQCSEDTAGTG